MRSTNPSNHSSMHRRTRFRRALRVITSTALLGAVTVSSMSGCSRQRYRRLTDTEAYYLLDEKRDESCEDGTAPYRIEIDSRSRMFDPFNPDRQPMPEDDPQSHQYMRRVDGKKGYALWEANGRTNIVENPQWWTYLPLDERGVLVLNLEDAVRTALLHSPSYQSALEEMYLSALDVSSERFLFDSQFFGGFQTNYVNDGPRRNNAAVPNSRSVLGVGPFSRNARPLVMQKQFATGADLLVGFANSLTWQLAGPNDQSSSTILDFSLIQPLLRQGGRDVVLERLTLAERTLLANVRSFERYRRGFYLQVATGQNPDTQPRRRGGVLGGAGFQNFTGLGGGFGNLGGGGGGAAAGIPGANGYLGLLQDQLQIANQEETVAQLTDVYLQLRDNYRELLLTIPQSQQEIPQQQLQVVQAQQDLYDFQTSLLQLQVQYQQTLDAFKQSLGLPPYLCVEIKDPLLDRFRLVSQALRDRRAELTVSRTLIGDENSRILELSRIETTEADGAAEESFRAIAGDERVKSALDGLAVALQPLDALQQRIMQQDLAEVREDIARLEAAIPTRRRQLDRLLGIAKSEVGMVCSLLPTGTLNTSFLEGEGLEELPEKLLTDLERFEDRFEKHLEDFGKLQARLKQLSSDLGGFDSDRARFQAISEGVVLGSQDLIAEISEDVLALQLIQARARTEAAILPEIDLEPEVAFEIARTNRRDWLNNRAALVNSWRAIEFVADDLESFLDFTVSGDVQNFGDNPLALRSSTGRLRVGLAWDAPITRLQERNNYRQILIEYSRAKRQYYQFEDAIWGTMRNSLRAIRQNQLSFEIQRFAVQTATLQISITEDLRSISETLGTVQGPTAARDATTALRALLNTQNQLIGIFVNYEAQRRGLDLNLGTMELDAEGLWIDPGALTPATVGGNFGPSVFNYGLTAGDALLRQQLDGVEQLPLEVAPSNNLPPSVPPADDFPRAAPAEAIVPPPPAVGAVNPASAQFPEVRPAVHANWLAPPT